jgi:hypothetical protein
MIIKFYQDPIFGSQYEFVPEPKKDYSSKNRNQKRKNISNRNQWDKNRK